MAVTAVRIIQRRVFTFETAAEITACANALAAALAAVPQEPRTCEFCDQPDGDPPAMLDVCPACWNRANEGSGWMQRALKAEAAVAARPPEAPHER
jgi:hypothetical protein